MRKKRKPSKQDPGSDLGPAVQAVLEHPARRQILRALGATDRTWSPSELSKRGKVSCSVSCASYHMRVLKSHRLVTHEASEPTRGSVKHYFSSAVEEDGPVLAVLRETEHSDRLLLAAGAS